MATATEEAAAPARACAPARLHPRARRPPRGRGDRGAALPRRRPVVEGRVPRRRRVLRDQRLPDHLPAARRLREPRPHRPRAVLVPPGPAPVPGAVRDARGGEPLRRALPPRRARAAPRRGGRRALLRRELVPDLPRPVVLPGGGPPAAAAARVVAGGGGAVLPAVADHPVRRVEGVGRAAQAHPARRARRRRGVDGADGGALPPVPRPVARLLRHRHTRRRAAARRRARVRVGAVEAAGEDRQQRGRGARRRRGRQRAGAAVDVPHRELPRPGPLPRRLPRGRDRLRGPDRGDGAPEGEGLGRGARPGGVPLDRRAGLRHLPVALADLHGHPSALRRRPHRAAAAGAAARAHVRHRRALVPLPRGADPPRRARALVVALQGVDRARRAPATNRWLGVTGAVVAVLGAVRVGADGGRGGERSARRLPEGELGGHHARAPPRRSCPRTTVPGAPTTTPPSNLVPGRVERGRRLGDARRGAGPRQHREHLLRPRHTRASTRPRAASSRPASTWCSASRTRASSATGW